MFRISQIMLFALTLVLIGCAKPGQYPISHQECTAKDPVLDLDANDCTVPGV